MRKDITVAAEPRETRGKNNARRMRTREQIPAVVYGTGKDPVAVTVSPKEINKILFSSTGHNTIFNLEVTGRETTPVMVVDWQHEPVRGNLLHIDLQRIDLSKRLRVKVPVTTHGDPKGVKIQGGIYEIITREIEIECLPDEIPEKFDMDVAEFMIGQSLRASDIPMAEGIVLVSSPDQVISHVIATRGSAEEEQAAAAPAAGAAGAAGAAEPEVVKKGKKEEEGGPAKK